jgi:hypothetical protein
MGWAVPACSLPTEVGSKGRLAEAGQVRPGRTVLVVHLPRSPLASRRGERPSCHGESHTATKLRRGERAGVR